MRRVQSGDVLLLINGNRDGYSPEQCDPTMTVGELKALLEDYDDDAFVMLINDNGYTYGSVGYEDIRDAVFDEEEYEE